MRTPRERLLTNLSRIAAIVLIVISLLVTRSIQPLKAQGGTCSDTLKLALQHALQQCSNTPRNSVCYGSHLAQATSKSGAGLNFSAPGHTIPLTDLGSLSLSGYKQDTGELGVALLNVPATLAGTNVGSNATVIVFGNTQVTNGSAPGALPMQAFYLRNSAGAPGCEQVAADGILIQTPSGGQKVQLVANGVQLTVGSTVFLSARPDEDDVYDAELNIQTLDGEVTVEADGETLDIPAGAQSNVPLDEVNGEYEVYDGPEELDALDTEEFLDFPFENLPESLDLEELQAEWEEESAELEENDTDDSDDTGSDDDSGSDDDGDEEPPADDDSGTDDDGDTGGID